MINQAFAIKIKRVVYLINFIDQKTLRVRLFYVATSFTSTIPTTKYTFFPNGYVGTCKIIFYDDTKRL